MRKKLLATTIITGLAVLTVWSFIAVNEGRASGTTPASPAVSAAPPTTTEATTTTSTPPTTQAPPVEVRVEAPPAPHPQVAPPDGCWMDLARQVGWPEETLGHLNYIIQRESRCDPTAYANRPSTLDNSRGLLQINSFGSLDGVVRRLCGIDPEQLFDPAINLTCGLAYYRNAGWSPWGG